MESTLWINFLGKIAAVRAVFIKKTTKDAVKNNVTSRSLFYGSARAYSFLCLDGCLVFIHLEKN